MDLPSAILLPETPPVVVLQRKSHARTPSAPVICTETAAGSPLRALLVGQSFDDNLRRAGQDMISRLKKKSKRASDLPGVMRGRTTVTRGIEVELHILILSRTSTTSYNNSLDHESTTQANIRSAILAMFREAGARPFVHVTLTPLSPRFSISMSSSSTSDSLRENLLKALQNGTLGKAISVNGTGIEAAGLVLGAKDHDAGDQDQTRAFVQVFAQLFASPTSSIGSPAITLYLPKHPYLSDFDLDLPLDEVRALRVANAASFDFKVAFDKALALSPTRHTSLEQQQSSQASKRNSYTFLLPTTTSQNAMPMPSPSSASQKPLLLRPAPSAGPQNLTIRLSIDANPSVTEGGGGGGKDVVLRVTECQTPLEAPTNITSGRSWIPTPPLSPSAAISCSRPGLKPLSLVPGAFSSSGSSVTSSSLRSTSSRSTSSRSSSPSSSISSKRGGPQLHVFIPPTSSSTSRPGPSSFFSPDTPSTPKKSEAEEEEDELEWDPRKVSPLEKVSLIKNRKDTFEDGVLTPISQSVMELVRTRVEKAEARMKRFTSE